MCDNEHDQQNKAQQRRQRWDVSLFQPYDVASPVGIVTKYLIAAIDQAPLDIPDRPVSQPVSIRRQVFIHVAIDGRQPASAGFKVVEGYFEKMPRVINSSL